MALFDMPLEALEAYLPPREEPADFDEFWRRTLAEQDAEHPLAVELAPVETGLTEVVTQDVTFTGFGGQPVKGWYHRPASATGDLPVVVQYFGYNGGRGLPHQSTLMAQAGFATLVMDNRAQGAGWQVGHTHDVAPSGPQATGFLTQGIGSPETAYYRRLYVDAARAVRTARELPGVDAARVLTRGGSQGGALSLAAAYLSGLAGVELRGAIVDVPFLTHVRRATEITDADPYGEIVRYLHQNRDQADTAFRTLSYLDGMNLAARIEVPALFSVGLRDVICPPSCVYAGYNHYAGPKEIVVYPYNGHEQGEAFQDLEHITFARKHLA